MKVRIDPETRQIIHPIELRDLHFLGGDGGAPAAEPRAEDRRDMYVGRHCTHDLNMYDAPLHA